MITIISIPINWYKTILKPETKTGKVGQKSHTLAISILSEIAAISLSLGNEFRYSYSHIVETFMCSDADAREAILFLENLGLIKRVFKTEVINGVNVSNIMFIKVFQSILQKATNNTTPLQSIK